jgi:hypothetical protein
MPEGFRVRRTGLATTPFRLERLDEDGRVVSVRPASAEEWTLYRMLQAAVGR